MQKELKRIIRKTCGWICIVVGLIGLFLPFVQGILLIVIGYYLLNKGDGKYDRKSMLLVWKTVYTNKWIPKRVRRMLQKASGNIIKRFSGTKKRKRKKGGQRCCFKWNLK